MSKDSKYTISISDGTIIDAGDTNAVAKAIKNQQKESIRGCSEALLQLEELDATGRSEEFAACLLSISKNAKAMAGAIAQAVVLNALAVHVRNGGKVPENAEESRVIAEQLFPSGATGYIPRVKVSDSHLH